LTVEELPFADAERENAKHAEFIFDVKKLRWPIRDLWGSADILSDACPSSISIEREKSAAPVEGLIRSDVGWRDYRLVEQAYAVACFSPVVPRLDGAWRVSRGVDAELQKAVSTNVPFYVFQDPKFDPNGKWLEIFGTPGSMGYNLDQLSIENKDSTEELFESISRR